MTDVVAVPPIIIGGASGSGKSTVGALLAARLSFRFVDGDDMHPASNIAKMAAGIPLRDDDRWPWLDSIGALIGTDSRVVVACSALRRVYRDRLRAPNPDLAFMQLVGTADVLGRRIAARADHFMPATLLDSQLQTLEALGGDEIGLSITVDRSSPERIVGTILDWLGRLKASSERPTQASILPEG